MRLIDADVLSKIIENTYLEGDSTYSFRVDSATEDTLIGKFQTIDIISDMPTVDVLDKIKDEIANEKGTFPKEHYIRIIDKYKGDKE